MNPAAASPVVADLKSLGGIVRNRRAQSHLRIDDTAAYCDVSADVLSRLENGRPVRVDKLMQVLDGLGLKMLLVTRSEAEDVSRMLRNDKGTDAGGAG
jgi:transcriptional regulator with XRE-family HTH domain